MELIAGSRLGPYEVFTPLGAGGMGVVYRAHDTKLNRDVALKILPPEFTHDPERVARFRREAQVLASLNHPHIAAIYGLDEANDTQFLVLELVEGPTLADRIARGPVPLDEALPIARQIAEALEAAHEKGIIHRDLKPANIALTANDQVKVLDFGLAKALEAGGPGEAGGPSALANSPTITTPAMTRMGMILGTAAYMSPEQAKGRAADRRSDLWAFGAVVYEMLAGKRAFAGEDVSDTLVSVLRDEPEWTSLPTATPSPIGRLLRRCLQKDRTRRLESAADARLEIEDALTSSQTDVTPTRVERDVRTRRERLAWTVAAALILVAAGLAVPMVRSLREAPPSAEPETRLDILTPGATSVDAFALSPDGRSVVFVAAGDGPSRLWLRALSSTTAQPLAGTDGADTPFWSPDSKSIMFVANGQLKRVDLGAGAPQVLATPAFQLGGAWNADGVILFSRGNGGLFRVAATGGEAVPVTTLSEGQYSQGLPVFLPDGRHFLFGAVGAPDVQGVFLGALGEIAAARLTGPDPTPGGWYLPPGWLLWVRGDTLTAQRFGLKRSALTGDPVTVVQSLSRIATSGGLPAVSVSPTGLVAYRSSATVGRQLRWFDRAGKALGTLGPQDATLSGVSLSLDGTRVVVRRTVQGNTDLWLFDAVRSTRFTFDSDRYIYPHWSPDGKQIVVAKRAGGGRISQGVVKKPANGASGEVPLVESSQTVVANDWSRDGRFLLYHSLDPTTGRDLWVRPMQGDSKPWILLKTPFDERWGQFSPDGRWVAYQSNESGRNEIYLRAFVPPAPSGGGLSGPAGQWQVSTAGGVYPRWRADGQELFYLSATGDLMAVPIVTRGTIPEPKAPVALFRPLISGGGIDNIQGWQYDVAGDGHFLVNTVDEKLGTSPITLIRHWTPPVTK